MNVSCGSCQTVFRVDPEKVPSAGVRARCSVCSGVFWVRRESATAPPPLPPTREPEPPRAPEVAVTPPAAALPQTRTAVPEPPPHSRAAAHTAAPTSRPGPAVTPPPSRPVAPSWAAPPPAAPSVPPVALPHSRTAAPEPAAPAAAPAPLRPSTRPTNPFLSQDPQARARRLARALVSDIVVYHPAKRRDGLRDGSLKLLFEDEIRKSWEEYVEQVGRELAEATSFFTDALNDILADGQPVFP
jgi:predicted Zn finger-like uncharacterized protein